MTSLEEYYNKFNEDKRLLSRHGRVEYTVTRHYIDEVIGNLEAENISIADIGAGTGRYSIALAQAGYQVTAVEKVSYNLGILKKHARDEGLSEDRLTAYKGDARKLKRLKENSFDLTLLLGPMYHLHSVEDKVMAMKEALRITKSGGYILVGYVMADYALVRHGFMEHNVLDSIERGALTEDYAIKSDENELYDYVRLSDIDVINEQTGAKRIKIISPDGPADYIRPFLNNMSEQEFEKFVDYQIKNAERPELIGAGSHTVDIVMKR